jgi:putative ABC transport system substrate-binding protein
MEMRRQSRGNGPRDGRIIATVVLLLCLVLPLETDAQQAQKIYRVGVLTPSASQWQPTVFREAMRDLGYRESANLTIKVRDAGARLEVLPQLAMDLVRDNVDVIVAINTPSTRAAIGATRTIPIVMSVVGDPLATGFVTNLSRPGGNVTGVSNLNREITAKRLQLLKEAVPAVTRVAVLFHPDDPISGPQVEDTKAAASQLGVEPKFFAVRDAEELPGTFAAMIDWRAQAILRLAGQAFPLSRPTVELALKHHLPTMMLTKQEVNLGGLLSYDSDRAELFRHTALFVDKILKGANPGELPVEQPRKFELAINLKTAKALGLTVPSSLLLRADRVIQP